MSIQAFPGWFAAPEQKISTIVVDGSAVGATPGSAGLDTRGKFFCTISKTTNTVTINFLTKYALPPIPLFVGLTDNLGFNISVRTESQLVFTTVERDDNTTGINDADFAILFLTDGSNKAYS